MAEAYPLHIRTILSASKSRSQPATFRIAEPRRGYGYVQEIGTDVPVFWDVEFRFTRPEAVVFDVWFRVNLRRGVEPFTLSLDTEYGAVEHECRFMPDGLLPLRQEANVFSYSASIMARKRVVPQEFDDAASLIVGLPDWSGWASLLDIAVSRNLPQV